MPDVQYKRNLSVALSILGSTELFFVQPGVKVNGDYYREVLLKEKLLPCIVAALQQGR